MVRRNSSCLLQIGLLGLGISAGIFIFWEVQVVLVVMLM